VLNLKIIMDQKNINTVYGEAKEDMAGRKSLYNARAYEIFWRNFLAGISRTLGSIFLYIVFFIIVNVLILKYVLPIYMPLLNKITNIMDSIEKMQKTLPQTSGTLDIPFSIIPKK